MVTMKVSHTVFEILMHLARK